MRKLVVKTAVFLLPFILLFTLFFSFETSDYFGLRGNPTYNSRPVSSMRKVLMNHPSRAVFGDSRIANTNMDYVKEVTGLDYTMLGFGGASLADCIDLFWFTAENTELEEVVFSINFYSAWGEQQSTRIPQVTGRATNVFEYVPRINYWIEAAYSAKCAAVNVLADVLNHPEWAVYPEDPTDYTAEQNIPQERGEKYRKNLEDYAAIINSNLPDVWWITYETYQQLYEIADYCDSHDIHLIFVFPPLQDSIYELVIEARGFDEEIDKLKNNLKSVADVYDMQFRNDFSANEDYFFDGFHLASAQKKDLARWIFANEESEYIVRYYREG